MEAASLAERAARVGDGLDGSGSDVSEDEHGDEKTSASEASNDVRTAATSTQRWRDENDAAAAADSDAGRVSPSGLLKREDLLSILERRAEEAAGEALARAAKTGAWSWAWWATPTSARARR